MFSNVKTPAVRSCFRLRARQTRHRNDDRGRSDFISSCPRRTAIIFVVENDGAPRTNPRTFSIFKQAALARVSLSRIIKIRTNIFRKKKTKRPCRDGNSGNLSRSVVVKARFLHRSSRIYVNVSLRNNNDDNVSSSHDINIIIRDGRSSPTPYNNNRRIYEKTKYACFLFNLYATARVLYVIAHRSPTRNRAQ